MAASARRPDGRPAARQAASGRKGPAASPRAPRTGMAEAMTASVGEFILRNPLALGSGTAFLVALSFVSANAIWGQTESHAGTFFQTRPLPSGWSSDPAGTTGSIPPVPRPAPDPTLRKVQAQLGILGLYDGAVDGLPGPGTRKAVAAFQARNGLKVSGEVDAALLARLAQPAEAAAAVSPNDRVAAPKVAPGAGGPERQRMAKIQAGLKAFGIDGVEVDGIIGARTRAGIREFQGMFGLPQTGEADDALLAKMRETGLTE